MQGNFIGVSRRQRQVNLSGKPSPGSRISGVTHAREVRAQRETERRRNKAAVVLQSAFRGYFVRQKLYSELRATWDSIGGTRGCDTDGRQDNTVVVGRQLDGLALLLVFWNVYDEGDRRRLVDTAISLEHELRSAGDGDGDDKMVDADVDKEDLNRRRVLMIRLSRKIIFRYLSNKIINTQAKEDVTLILRFLTRLASSISEIVDISYYTVISQLVGYSVEQLKEGNNDSLRLAILDAVFKPLGVSGISLKAFNGLVHSLCSPHFFEQLSLNQKISADYQVDLRRLSEAIIDTDLSVLTVEARLWLLAHTLFLQRIGSALPNAPIGPNDFVASRNDYLVWVSCISKLLEFCSSDIMKSWRIEATSGTHRKYDGTPRKSRTAPLQPFVKEELQHIQTQAFIHSLMLYLWEPDYQQRQANTKQATHIIVDGKDAVQIVSSAVLMILTTFLDSRVELQRWLHVSRTFDGTTSLRFFWKYVSRTSTLLSCKKIDSTLQSLKSYVRDPQIGNDWVVLLAFLEMFGFSLLVLDDEQFFSESGSYTLDIADLKELSICLKHIAFTVYWSGKDIIEGHTGADTSSYNQFARLKEIVVRVVRMIYHRDSRRRFLPVDHWLMTAEIDNFQISAVVAEQEKMQDAQDSDSDSDESDEDEDAMAPSFGKSDMGAAAQRQTMHQQQLTPRLSILEDLPFFIPFETRVAIFREFVGRDRESRLGGTAYDVRHTKHHAKISRESIFEDAFEQFYPIHEGLKDPISITFLDKWGEPEAGIDGGGVSREFLQSITREALNVDDESGQTMALFVESPNGDALVPNPTILEGIRLRYADQTGAADWEISQVLKKYEFLGRIIGKCLYDEVLVEVEFANFEVFKWAQGDDILGVDDLYTYDREFWSSLQKLKYYDDDTLKSLSQTFSTELSVPIPDWNVTRVIPKDLKPNGSQIAVTPSNRLEFIYRMARWKLVGSTRLQTAAFVRGLSAIISRSWLRFFNQSELAKLISGSDRPLDLADLKSNTVYGGLYDFAIGPDGKLHPTVEFFWQVMEEFKEEERRNVLKYVTSVSKAPLLGFSHLQPRFAIRDAGNDNSRLPSSSTCVNLLKLPIYKDKATLKKKLLYAVNSGAGFDLS